MDLFSAYRALNQVVLDVIKSTNKLEPVKEDVKVESIRVEERPILLTENSFISGNVITAHNLSQYQNNFYKLNVEDNVHSALEELLAIDEQVEVKC